MNMAMNLNCCWLSRLNSAANAHPWRAFAVVALLLAVWQLPGVFFGLDLCDAGFYLTFYDNIFTRPATVSYNFMYYLSGLLGGLLQMLFPAMGEVGMRLAGLAVNILTMAVTYGALHRLVTPAKALLGCALVVVAYVPSVLTLNYDLVSLLLYVTAIAAVMRGLRDNSLALLVAAGLAVGVNCFSRTPNVVGLALAAAPLLKVAYCNERPARALGLMAGFVASAAMGMAAVIGVMAALGHLQLWLGNLHDLRAIASDASASHSVGGMVMAQLKFYAQALWATVKIGAVVAVSIVSHRKITRRWLDVAVQACCLVVAAWLMWRMLPLLPVWGLCFVGCLWMAFAPRATAELKVAAWLGLFLLLAFPLGSDTGAVNNGTLIAWIAAPVAVASCCRRRLLPFVAVFVIGCGLQLAKGNIYFDGGPLWQKTAVVDSPRTAMLRTTPLRASVVNSVLAGIAPHIQPSDTLLAFGSIPLMNYLTGTCPAMGCSWPEQLSHTMLARRIDSLSVAGCRPLVLQQKFTTIGQQWGSAAESHLTAYETHNVYLDDRKLAVMRNFIARQGYRVAYSDRYFVLFVPPSRR